MMATRIPSRWIILRYGFLVACAALSLSVWTGCTAERRYQTLSFFFDGVPDPNAPKVAGRSRGPAGPRGAVAVSYVHKPYAEGQCDACHAGGVNSVFRTTNVVAIESNVCLNCHQNIVNQYPVMHGPVSSVECLRCHTPHESNTRHLLASSSPRVCVQCHVPELLSPYPPEHFDKTDCLTCHVAHGGASHGLLRADATTQPAARTVPASTTALIDVPGQDCQ